MTKNIIRKRWLLFVFSILFSACAIVCFTNWFIDPLWSFNHDVPKWALKQSGFNERKQKTNYLRYHDLDIDTLLLGSSRVTWIDPRNFSLKSFNFSANAAMPREYPVFLAIAQQFLKKPIKNIVIGIDFGGANIPTDDARDGFVVIKEQFNNGKPRTNRLKELFNFKTLVAFITNLEGRHYIYDKNFVGYQSTMPSSDDWKKSGAGGNGDIIYRYDDNLYPLMASIRDKYNNSNFIIFTTPLGNPQYRYILEADLMEEYERWIKEMVSIFGGIWNFMYVNSVSSNPSLYWESQHFGPKVGEYIANRITNKGGYPADFGVYVTPDNVEEHLKDVRRGLDMLLKSRDSWDEIIDSSEY